ncbi:hypothetical protein FFLO_05347 [Filobasidium floriforme]|uniref:Uncharacterized protein n=1 Tax=Filobasidium floriforme TaxID=5210 RepID=A0A8K0JIE3_9TREE|nr:hypothetical protein FFLO_05347 [Filobasidium floriforme]
MPEKVENVLPALVEADREEQARVDVELDEMARKREQAKQEAQDRYQQKEARKSADHQQEWLLRQKEKRKDVSTLLDASALLDRIKQARTMIQEVAREIKESDIRVVLPFHPGYSRDLTMARKYELDKQGERGPEVEFVELFDELASNYAEALARFRALSWFPDEDLVFVASRETNDLRHDNKDDLEDLISLLNYVNPSQGFFVWFQDFKRDIDHVYFMRTGTETLLRTWFRTKPDRQALLAEAGLEGEAATGEEGRKLLFQRMEKCFLDQGVEVPEAYRYKTLEEAEVRDRFGFMDFGEKIDKKEDKAGDENKDKDEDEDQLKTDDKSKKPDEDAKDGKEAAGIVVKMRRIRGDKRTRPTVDMSGIPKRKDVTKPIRRRRTEEKAVRSRRAHKDLKPDRQAKHDPEARARARTPRVKTPRVRTPRSATGARIDRRLEKASPGDVIPSPGIDALAQTVSSLRPELLDSPLVQVERRRTTGRVGSYERSVELGAQDGNSGSFHSFASAAGSGSIHTAETDFTGSQRSYTMTDRTGSTDGSRGSHSSNPFSNSYVPGLSTLASDAATNSTNVTSIYQFSSTIPETFSSFSNPSNPSSYDVTNDPSSHLKLRYVSIKSACTYHGPLDIITEG